MKCPKCGEEVEVQPITALYGFKEEVGAALLAEGNLKIAFHCGIAIMTEQDEEVASQPESLIITPEKGIILL
jgi:hypothetical protein